jgi:HlyD family secretion protein
MQNKKILLVPLALIVVAGAVAYRFYPRQAEAPRDRIQVFGNIEVTEVDVGFKLAGRVEARDVTEGQSVRAGQVVARLENTDVAQEVAVREAEVRVARAALAELEAGARPEEIAQAEAGLEWAKAEASRAQLEYARQKDLFDQQITPPSGYEAAEAAHKAAQARVREAAERLALLRKGPRQEQIEQARGRLESAQRAWALAQTRLGYTTLVSPMTGVVLTKSIEPGEYVVPGTPVITVGDLEHPWLRAYIQETDLGRVKLGQQAVIRTDSYPGRRYEGRISFIASQAEFTPKNIQTPKERVKLVYRIKVDLGNPNLELKPGMPADGEVLLAAPQEAGR